MAGPIKYTDLLDLSGSGELLDFTKSVKALGAAYGTFAKKLEGDGQKVAGALGALTTQTVALRTAMAGVNLSTDQERTSYANLSAQLQQLFQEQQRLKDAEAGLATTRRTATDATKGLTAELRKQQAALREAFAAGDTERITAAAQAILTAKSQTDELSRALRGANSIYTATANSYRAMENEARALNAQLKNLGNGMDADSAEAKALQARLAEVNKAMIAFGRATNDGHANVGRYAESIMEAVGSLEKQRAALLADSAALRTQAQATGLSRDQQERLQRELAQTDAELDKVEKGLRSYGVAAQQAGGVTSGVGDGARSLVTSLAGAYVGIQGVANALQQVFEANIQYSDAVADVAKTTGLSSEAVNELAENLKKVDTRTSLQGLLDIAAVGGQLGVAASDIESFTKVIDISVQALGDDFKGGAEEIATQLGKINTVFGKQLGTDLSQNLLHIGSALNQLGAVGAATAPQLADVARRTGAIASSVGLGLDSVLAYAAVLEEVGVSAEVSGTSLNRLFGTLSTKTEASFKIAKLGDTNLTLREFKRLVNTDFEGAIQAFLRGLNAGGTSTTRLNSLLATLKLQSGEAKNTIITLARNTDLYKERLEVANQELKTGISVAEEAAKKNDTLGGSYEKLKNSLSNLFTGGALGGFLKDVVDMNRERLDLLVTGFNKLADAYERLKVKSGLAAPKERGGLDVQFTNTKDLVEQANAADKLLTRYQELAKITNKSTTQQAEQSNIVRQLQAAFSSSVVEVNKETEAVSLNTEAVAKAIARKRELFENQKQSFADQLAQSDRVISGIEEGINRLQQAVIKQESALGKSGIGEDRIKEIRAALKEQDEKRASSGINVTAGSTLSFTANELRAVEAATNAEKELAKAEAQLKAQQAQRAKIAADLAAITKLGAAATTTQTKATGDDIEADKKKKQAVADVAKEEYELQRQRLQARIADLDRQADNPANSEAIRTEAVRKGTAARIELAELERVELIREAAQTNREKINGDEATSTARVRLTEAYQAQLLKATREGNTKLLALQNALLNHLGELDKITIEGQITAAEKVRDDVNKTYDERQRAARRVAEYQIELAAIVRDAEIRGAQGALDKIEQANKKYEAARAKASASVKVYDSQKDIDEQSASYARLALAVEDSYAKRLTSQETYQHEVRDLENQREAEAIAALEAEYGETVEVLNRKAALRRKKNQEELTEEQEKERKRAQIIEESARVLQGLGDGYYNYQSAQLTVAAEREQASYENALKVAGDNIALKTKAEQDHAAATAKIRHDQAVNERDAALFSIAISTAMAVAKSLGQFGLPLATPFIVADVVIGGLQAAAVLAKPIPQYFKGREGGPAELAMLGERGPELVGRPGSFRLIAQPSLGYLAAGDQVVTAPKTQQLLQEHVLLEGRLMPQPLLSQEGLGSRAQFHREQQDMAQQAYTLRLGSHKQREAELSAMQFGNQQLLAKLEQVRREIEEQGYRRWNELGQTIQEIKKGNTVQLAYDNRRYNPSAWKSIVGK
jgi:TP901 family phage tail tape measure protein